MNIIVDCKCERIDVRKLLSFASKNLIINRAHLSRVEYRFLAGRRYCWWQECFFDGDDYRFHFDIDKIMTDDIVTNIDDIKSKYKMSNRRVDILVYNSCIDMNLKGYYGEKILDNFLLPVENRFEILDLED